VVKALEFCSKLCRLNRIDCPGLINGGLKSLILPAAEEGEDGLARSLVRFLSESRQTSLTSLDLRFVL
jgi:hypothetical protein